MWISVFKRIGDGTAWVENPDIVIPSEADGSVNGTPGFGATFPVQDIYKRPVLYTGDVLRYDSGNSYYQYGFIWGYAFSGQNQTGTSYNNRGYIISLSKSSAGKKNLQMNYASITDGTQHDRFMEISCMGEHDRFSYREDSLYFDMYRTLAIANNSSGNILYWYKFGYYGNNVTFYVNGSRSDYNWYSIGGRVSNISYGVTRCDLYYDSDSDYVNWYKNTLTLYKSTIIYGATAGTISSILCTFDSLGYGHSPGGNYGLEGTFTTSNFYAFGLTTTPNTTVDIRFSTQTFSNSSCWVLLCGTTNTNMTDAYVSSYILFNKKLAYNPVFVCYKTTKTTSSTRIYSFYQMQAGGATSQFALSDTKYTGAVSAITGMDLCYTIGYQSAVVDTTTINIQCNNYAQYYPTLKNDNDYIYAWTHGTNRNIFKLFEISNITISPKSYTYNTSGFISQYGTYYILSSATVTDRSSNSEWTSLNSSVLTEGKYLYLIQANASFTQIIMYIYTEKYNGTIPGIRDTSFRVPYNVLGMDSIICFSKTSSGSFKRVSTSLTGMDDMEAFLKDKFLFKTWFSTRKPISKTDMIETAGNEKSTFVKAYGEAWKVKHTVVYYDKDDVYYKLVNGYQSSFGPWAKTDTRELLRIWKVKFAEPIDA